MLRTFNKARYYKQFLSVYNKHMEVLGIHFPFKYLLSKRQKEILRLLGEGKTDTEIAAVLSGSRGNIWVATQRIVSIVRALDLLVQSDTQLNKEKVMSLREEKAELYGKLLKAYHEHRQVLGDQTPARFVLTGKQERVLELMSKGWTQKLVAEDLGCGQSGLVKTLKSGIKRIRSLDLWSKEKENNDA